MALRERKLTSKFGLDLLELTNDVSSVSMRRKVVRIIALAFFVFHTKLHDHFGSFRLVLVI